MSTRILDYPWGKYYTKYATERFFIIEEIGGCIEFFKFEDHDRTEHFVVHEVYDRGASGKYLQFGNYKTARQVWDTTKIKGSFSLICDSMMDSEALEKYLDYRYPSRPPFYR